MIIVYNNLDQQESMSWVKCVQSAICNLQSYQEHDEKGQLNSCLQEYKSTNKVLLREMNCYPIFYYVNVELKDWQWNSNQSASGWFAQSIHDDVIALLGIWNNAIDELFNTSFDV